MSKAKDVSDALTARIEQIKGSAPYSTDIGKKVLRGRRTLDEAMLPCTVIIEDEDGIEARGGLHGEKVKVAQTYFIEGHCACNPDQPNDKAHEILADLKLAIFGGDPKLGGAVFELRYNGRVISTREDGAEFVAAGIEIEAVFVEDVTAP